MSEPREWQIYFIEGHLHALYCQREFDSLPELDGGDEELVHVIEYSAYEALRAEVAAIKARILDYKKHPEVTILVCDQTIENMADELAEARAEVDQLKTTLEKHRLKEDYYGESFDGC